MINKFSYQLYNFTVPFTRFNHNRIIFFCQAQAATLTIAQAFNLAYECWQASQEQQTDRRNRRRDASKGRREAGAHRREPSGNRRESSGNRRESSGNRRESSGNRSVSSSNRRQPSGDRSEGYRKASESSSEPTGNPPRKQEHAGDLVHISTSNQVRTEAIVENRKEEDQQGSRRTGEEDKTTTSPSSGYNSCSSVQEEETFLIDLSSPGDGLERRCPGEDLERSITGGGSLEGGGQGQGETSTAAVAANKQNWVMFEDPLEATGIKEVTREMDLGFRK